LLKGLAKEDYQALLVLGVRLYDVAAGMVQNIAMNFLVRLVESVPGALPDCYGDVF
jgi:hypothetical protein